MNLKSFTCRFCLAGEGKGVNLFDRDLLLIPNLHSWINLTFGLKISEEDGLQKNVCMPCILFIYQAYFFIRKCQESENILTQNIEARAEAECIISPSRSGMISTPSRGSNSGSPVQGSSPSTTHAPVQNERWNEISFRANENSIDTTSKESTFDHLPFGVEQKASANHNALPVSCNKSSQQRQQKLKEKCVSKNSGSSNLEYERNQIGAQCNNGAKPLALHPSESQDCSCHSFQSPRDQKLVQCLCNHSSKEQSASKDEECTLNCDATSQRCSEKQEQSSALSDDIYIIEPYQEIINKKSEFHMEFIKFLNSNVCQSDNLIDICKEIDNINLKRELMVSQGIEPDKLYDFLQSKGKIGKTKDRSHNLRKLKKNSVNLRKVTSNMLLSDGSGKSDVFPSSGSNVSHHSKCAIKSVPENKPHVYSSLKEIVHGTTSVLEGNYTKSVDTPSIHNVSLKEMDGVNLEQPSHALNVSISESHSQKFPGTLKEKHSLFEVYNRSVTNSLPSPIQKNTNAPIGFKVESNLGKEKHEDDHSCVKAARIVINKDHSTMLHSVAGKVSRKRIKPSLPGIKSYNWEPEYSRTVSNSPCSNLPLPTERKSYPFKELDSKLDMVSRTLSRKSNSPHVGSFSHSDQSLQCILKESLSNRNLKDGSKKLSSKNSFVGEITKCSRMIDNNESSLQFHDLRHKISEDVFQPLSRIDIITHGKPIARNSNSRFFEGKSLVIEGENVISMAHQVTNDHQYLKNQCSLGKPDVKASNKKSMKVKMDSSSVMEKDDTEKLQISLGPKVTCAQLKSSTPCISSVGKAEPIDSSYKDSSKRLFNHDSPSPEIKYTVSDTQGNSLTQIPSVNAVQSSNVLLNVSSISNAKITLKSDKPLLNDKSLRKKRQRNKRRIPRKIRERVENLNRFSFTFPCSICSKMFSKHDLMLKHLLTHSKNRTLESFVNGTPLEPKIPKSLGKFTEVDKAIGQQEVFESKTFTAIGAVKDEKIDEIRAIIQQHLIVNDSGSLNGDCKSFRCPACFKLIPDWFEVTMHIVLQHDSLSSEWPLSFLFSPKILNKLTNKHLDRSKLPGTIMQLPQPEIPFPQTLNPSTLNSCEHCFKQFSSNSALLKHLIWAHNKSS